MNLLTAQLSHRQAIIVKDIAQNQIKVLISISSNHELCRNLSEPEKADLMSQLIRDFSKLVEFPQGLLGIRQISQSLFRHELFRVTFGGEDARQFYDIDGYPVDDIKALWRKITAADQFNQAQLN